MADDTGVFSTKDAAAEAGVEYSEALAFAEDRGLPRIGQVYVWFPGDVDALTAWADEDSEDDPDDSDCTTCDDADADEDELDSDLDSDLDDEDE